MSIFHILKVRSKTNDLEHTIWWKTLHEKLHSFFRCFNFLTFHFIHWPTSINYKVVTNFFIIDDMHWISYLLPIISVCNFIYFLWIGSCGAELSHYSYLSWVLSTSLVTQFWFVHLLCFEVYVNIFINTIVTTLSRQSEVKINTTFRSFKVVKYFGMTNMRNCFSRLNWTFKFYR